MRCCNYTLDTVRDGTSELKARHIDRKRSMIPSGKNMRMKINDIDALPHSRQSLAYCEYFEYLLYLPYLPVQIFILSALRTKP